MKKIYSRWLRWSVVLVWIGLASVCNGHDLLHTVFTFPRINAWLSSPPELDESLAGKLSKDVLICIGATNRAIAGDFKQRCRAADNLEKIKLSETELQVLYRFLAGTLGGRDPLVENDLRLLKGRIYSSLLFPGEMGPVEGLGAHLIEIVQSEKTSYSLFSLCIRKLATYYCAKWENRKDDWSDPERKKIEQLFWKLAEDKRIALEVNRMFESYPLIKFAEFRKESRTPRANEQR